MLIFIEPFLRSQTEGADLHSAGLISSSSCDRLLPASALDPPHSTAAFSLPGPTAPSHTSTVWAATLVASLSPASCLQPEL